MPNLDFSEFHPLDHSIWEPYCWGWAGGIPRHIKLWWAYQFKWPWQPYFAKRSCDKGIHNVVAYWTKLPEWDFENGKLVEGPAAGLQCRDCDWQRKA
jgi:hypothetical protein